MNATLVSRWILVGCLILASPQAAFAKGLFESLSGALNPEQAEETTHLSRLQPRESCGGDGRTSLLNAQVEQGLGVVRDTQLQNYLDGILAKLLAVSPMPDCSVTVYVTPHDATQAVALADGGILVALGFLRNLKSEDEVAALLAHELTHILSNHHESDAFVETQDSFLKGLDTANAAGSVILGVVDPELAQGLDAATNVGGAMYQISESLIAPAWTVEQEDEADLTGIDLMAAAGYNPRAMASLMDVIAVQDEAYAKVLAEREKLHQQQMQQTVAEAATTTDFNNPLSILSSAAKLTTGVVSGADADSHRPAAERKTRANAYIKQFHSKLRRRKFTTEPWEAVTSGGDSGATMAAYSRAAEARRVLFSDQNLPQADELAKGSVRGRFSSHSYPRLVYSEVRLKQGNRPKAMQNLEIALKEDGAPWQLYRSYAELQMLTGDNRGAGATVDRADAHFGQPLGIAPFAIKVHRAAGNRDKVAAYLNRCRVAGKRAHIKICETAAGIESKQTASPSSSGGSLFGSGIKLPSFGNSSGGNSNSGGGISFGNNN